ncbi:MAG: poly-gamma-glutamate biosynthesis protein PgsC/CapC [Pseudomonadota bacterium]
MDIFPLPIFPPGALSSSVVTTVWVGVFIIAFFNLRLGWVLSGLVVPGYVVPLFILNPWSAGVIIVEGMVTYFIVWLFSEYLSRRAPWCNFFGRDRFFALVLVSVLVRLFFDGWLLPIIGEFVVNHYQLQFDYRNQLHSFGLIIVALMANQFWKTGLVRGLIPLFTSLAITYVIVRFGLMELTNFSMSQLGYMYDDLAISILSAPKAYIILVITAFIASRMNLHYSWEFNGILIPALLALQWYQPYKILASFAEAFIILILAQAVLATPLFKSMTIEGARKLLLFFNISFIYKMALGYFMLWFMPEANTADYYAFGYLLATLLAVKMHDKHIVLKMTRATLQISLSGVLLASLLGFAMTLLPGVARLPSTAASTHIERLEQSQLIELIYLDKVSLSQGRVHNSFVEPLPQEIESFQNGLEKLLAYQQRREPALLQQASAYFAQVNYQTLLVQQRYIYLRESKELSPQRGWGIYVLDLEAEDRLLLEIPAPLDEWGTIEAGAHLFIHMQGGALAIAGSARRANKNGSSDMLTNYQSFFQTFHRVLAQQNVLQVRAYTQKSLRVLNETYQNPTDAPLSSSSLWLKSALPAPLELSQLEQLIGRYVIEWTATPFRNAQRNLTYTGFSELFLNREDVIKLLLSQISEVTIPLKVHEGRIEGYLQDSLLGEIAPKGTNWYKQPRIEELWFFDREVLTPLLKLIRSEYQAGHWSQAGKDQLRILAGAAAIVGYGFERYQGSKEDFLILKEQGAKRRYWGTYVFRLGGGQNYMVQVPRPIHESNSFEYAVTLFARLQAKVLLIAGTHPAANIDGSSDLVKDKNYRSLFSLVNQVVLREEGNDPMLVIQSRAFGRSEDETMADVLLAFDKGISSQAGLSELSKGLFGSIQAEGLSIQFVRGEANTVGYEVGSLPQSLYLSATQNKEFAILWLSATTRKYYRQQTELQYVQFNALNIPTVSVDLYEYIKARSTGEAVSKAFRARVKEYIQTQDILILQDLLTRWPQYRLERLIDVNSKQAFLLMYAADGKLSLVANLFPRDPDSSYRDDVRRFIETRGGWLELQ